VAVSPRVASRTAVGVEKAARRGDIDNPVETIRTIRLRWLRGTLHEVTSHMARAGLPHFAPPPWHPAVNAYRCEQCIQICVELAGVNRSAIELTVRSRHVSIRGTRDVAEPDEKNERALQTIAMEIDYGAFERDIHLPADVEVNQVHAEQKNGMLWIHLPLKRS
jgi:HSP20 family protein